MNHSQEQLTLDELRALVHQRRDMITFRSLDLNRLRQHHNCTTCQRNTSTEVGKYTISTDPSATPAIPGLFPRGPVTLEDIASHNFRIISDGTTCGTVKVPGSPIPEIALMIHFPDFNLIEPESTLNLWQLGHLLHLGALYGTACLKNGPHLAVPPGIRMFVSVSMFLCWI
jgi:hypothetical protein